MLRGALSTDLVNGSQTCTAAPAPQYSTSRYAAPVDNAPAVNLAKAGRTIPFKFAVTKDGAPDPTFTTAVGRVTACTGLTAAGGIDAIETYVTGGCGLQNNGDGTYQFNFRTSSAWRGCKLLSVVLGDGTVETAGAVVSFS